MVLRFIATLVLFLALVVFAVIASGAQVASYVHLPALGIVLLGAGLLSLVAHSPRDAAKAFADAFRTKASAADLRLASAYFGSLRRFVYLGGAIGLFTGTMGLLWGLTDKSQVGSGAALGLLSLLTALVVDAGIVSNLKSGIDRRLRGVNGS